jgi:hypothetical protein
MPNFECHTTEYDVTKFVVFTIYLFLICFVCTRTSRPGCKRCCPLCSCVIVGWRHLWESRVSCRNVSFQWLCGCDVSNYANSALQWAFGRKDEMRGGNFWEFERVMLIKSEMGCPFIYGLRNMELMHLTYKEIYSHPQPVILITREFWQIRYTFRLFKTLMHLYVV